MRTTHIPRPRSFQSAILCGLFTLGLGVAQAETPATKSLTSHVDVTPASAKDKAEELAKESQNPVANLISVPFQWNMGFGVGPFNAYQRTLNIQPVIPISVTKDWNIITRTILPVESWPAIRSDTYVAGIGDTTFTAFLSPAKSGKFVWGIGPAFLFPTASSSELGSGQWGLGPSIVGLYMGKHIVAGALFNNIWSYAGWGAREVNAMTLQPFFNYNFPGGWYLTTSPIITADWTASSRNIWTVPLGGGFGKIIHFNPAMANSGRGIFHGDAPGTVGDVAMCSTATVRFSDGRGSRRGIHRRARDSRGRNGLGEENPNRKRRVRGSGAGRRVQQRPAGAVQALVVQVGDRVQAEQVLEEIFHAATAEPEGGAEVVEVNGFVGVRSEKITRFSQPAVACGEAGCGWRDEIVASAAQGSEEGFEQFALEIMTDQGFHRCIAGLPDHRLAPVEDCTQAGLLARANSHGGTASEDRLGNVGKRRGQGGMKMRGGNGQCDVAIAGRSHGIQEPAGREETHVAVRVFEAEVEGASGRWAGADKDERETVCRHGSAKEHRRTERGEIEASPRADDAREPAECGSRTELAGFELRPRMACASISGSRTSIRVMGGSGSVTPRMVADATVR